MRSTQSKSIDRRTALLRGASQWGDRGSHVRRRAREALRENEWPPQVVEAALDAVLRDADEQLRAWQPKDTGLVVLAILPGNILGPAVATAYCAAAAGATLMLKSSSRELHLADIVAEQFEALGPPLARTLQPMRWSGGDVDFEARVFPLAQRIVVFGEDATVEDVKRRAPVGVQVKSYGSAYSIGFIPTGCDLAAAASAAAQDVALFDQRGCLSPQTIFVEGDEARTIMFAHALRAALDAVGRSLPRARAGEAERAAVAEFIRRLMVRAISPKTHALDTILIGPDAEGVPEYVVGVEPYSAPICAGFGRIVVVKPCRDAAHAAAAARSFGQHLDSVGIASPCSPAVKEALAASGVQRFCALGEMQRPPFGYRPQVADFAEGTDA